MLVRPWRCTFWAVLAFLVAVAFLWLFTPAHALPTPQEPPRRLSDVGCDPVLPMIRVGPYGLERSIVDEKGCVIGWVRWEPMVRSR
mgnify:CR=1 FL=1